jgi:hypothetical protein
MNQVGWVVAFGLTSPNFQSPNYTAKNVYLISKSYQFPVIQIKIFWD